MRFADEVARVAEDLKMRRAGEILVQAVKEIPARDGVMLIYREPNGDYVTAGTADEGMQEVYGLVLQLIGGEGLEGLKACRDSLNEKIAEVESRGGAS